MNSIALTRIGFFLFIALSLVACGSGEPASSPLDTPVQPKETVDAVQPLVMWSTENQPERADMTHRLLETFTQKSGIPVELVLVEENGIDNLIEINYKAGLLPDVMFFPMDFAAAWQSQGILDAQASTNVIQTLDTATFSEGALGFLTTQDGAYSAVPSDGWGQLLLYRQDLFDQFDLESPNTFERIRTAAETLTQAGYVGIMAGTDPNEVYTQQTFEQFALANGVQLINDQGLISLDSPEMVETLAFYTELMLDFGPGDTSTYWLQARERYLSGEVGMIIWSPFILDEMAGLRDANLPNCPECAEDITYLAEVSGILPSFSGPQGEPAQWGSVNCLGITTNADTQNAMQLVDFWMNEVYLDWLSLAPEGKSPMRFGTQQNPTLYLDDWRQLEVGVDRKAPLIEYYSAEVLETIIQGSNSMQRWGFRGSQSNGDLVGAIYSELIVPQAIADIMEGRKTPAQAAVDLQLQAEALLQELSSEE